MKSLGKKQTLTKTDKEELIARLRNPKLPSLGRVLARRRRSLTDHLVNELGLTTREKGMALVHSLAANPERLEFSYEADFLEAIEALPLTESSEDGAQVESNQDDASGEPANTPEPSPTKKAKDSENKRLKNPSEV